MHESYEFIINYILQTADIVNHVESGRRLRSYDYQNMIKNKFEWISKEEEKDGMQLPLNVIVTKYSSAIVALPFPVSRPPGAFVKFKGYNETSGIIKDVAPAAYPIDLRKDEHKNSKDVEVR